MSGSALSRRDQSEPCVYPLVYFRTYALDQSLGHRVVIGRSQVLMRVHGGADLHLVAAAHVGTVQPVAGRHKYAQLRRA